MGHASVTVLYDDECQFCRWSVAVVLAWDRRRRVRAVPIDSAEGRSLLAGLDDERARATAHVVTRDGRLLSGGAAVPEVVAALPGGRGAAYLARAAPGLTARAYDWVAAHRSGMGRILTRRQRRRASARLAKRAP